MINNLTADIASLHLRHFLLLLWINRSASPGKNPAANFVNFHFRSRFSSSSIMTNTSPLIPTYFTKLTQLINPDTSQNKPDSLCARIERRLADCLEAYGRSEKGRQKCADFFYDYYECRRETFQRLRETAIRRERLRQYKEGLIDKPYDEHPPIDGMIYY